MNKYIFLIQVIALIAFASCLSRKKTIYLQNKSGGNDTVFSSNKIKRLLKVGDILYVKVIGQESETTEFYNLSNSATSNTLTPLALYYNGYQVSDSGKIDLPNVGGIYLLGKDLNEARNIIKEKINEQLIGATVIVKPVFKVTIVGEAKIPGVYYITNDDVTLLEALGYAGDLTDYGDRRNVRIIRETDAGTEQHTFDLTDDNLYTSPYYYVCSNDIIYVQPVGAKFYKQNASNVNLILGILTATIVLVAFFR